jgi:para-aminobenzoate synthetase component 1
VSDCEPVVEELCPPPDVEQALAAFARRPHCLFLDSALRHPHLGRYSFLAAEPFDWLQVPADGSDGLAALAAKLAPFSGISRSDLPPFQGGAAGLFSYDLNRSLERIPGPRFDEFGVPALAVGLYDAVLAFDHVQDRAWIVSRGWPEQDDLARRRRAEARVAQLRGWLQEGGLRGGPGDGLRLAADRLSPADLAPSFPVGDVEGLVSNFSADAYRHTVQRVVEYICAGDAFQVNLAQRLLYPAHADALSLYLRLRRRNPATFAGYFDLGDWQVVSASPERFLQVRGRCV